MRYFILILAIVLLNACSMAPKQTEHHSGSIRIIKEEPTRYIQEQKYNTKIEQVDYNSSIIKPELDTGSSKTVKKKVYGSKITSRVKRKVSSQAESRANSVMNQTIDRSIDNLFK